VRPSRTTAWPPRTGSRSKGFVECQVAPLAASSAWKTQRPSVARRNLASKCPCAVNGPPVGPDGFTGVTRIAKTAECADRILIPPRGKTESGQRRRRFADPVAISSAEPGDFPASALRRSPYSLPARLRPTGAPWSAQRRTLEPFPRRNHPPGDRLYRSLRQNHGPQWRRPGAWRSGEATSPSERGQRRQASRRSSIAPGCP
jgi:hypothetical protein